MTKSVEIIIPRKGLSTKTSTIRTDALGFTGESCKQATEIFTNAFGAIRGEETKPELYQTAEGHEQVQEGGGG